MPRGPALLAAVGVVACLLGLRVDRLALAQAWLVAVLCLLLVPLGALGALATHGLTGGRWGDATAPRWQALAWSLPLVLLAMLPLLWAVDGLFAWRAPLESLPEVVQAKTLYLNLPFFLLRWVVYAVLWLAMLWALLLRQVRPLACVLTLIGLLYSVTFFGFDWVLSLEPSFYTDIFGLWLLVTAVGVAAALVMLLDDGRRAAARADVAALWLAVLLGWAFLAFAQYIIVWSGNLPHEIGWYLQHAAVASRELAGVCAAGRPAVLPAAHRPRAAQWSGAARHGCAGAARYRLAGGLVDLARVRRAVVAFAVAAACKPAGPGRRSGGHRESPTWPG